MEEEQDEELEVLQSIYEGDKDFTVINKRTFQYKYGEEGENTSFIIDIHWGEKYPNKIPDINLDLFYNKHLHTDVKSKIINGLLEQAELNLGTCMTYSLIEWLREMKEEFFEENLTELTDSLQDKAVITDQIKNISTGVKKESKEQMTKAQKRRMWDKVNAHGERERGWNWVDIVRHLSQTGNSNNN